MKLITLLLAALPIATMASPVASPNPVMDEGLGTMANETFTGILGLVDMANATLVQRQQASYSCGEFFAHEGGDLRGFLYARCATSSGQYARNTFLDLNLCIANIDGWVTWANNGQFMHRCSEWHVESGNFHARCRDLSQGWNWSYVHLDEVIGNNDGHLTCYNHVGS